MMECFEEIAGRQSPLHVKLGGKCSVEAVVCEVDEVLKFKISVLGSRRVTILIVYKLIRGLLWDI